MTNDELIDALCEITIRDVCERICSRFGFDVAELKLTLRASTAPVAVEPEAKPRTGGKCACGGPAWARDGSCRPCTMRRAHAERKQKAKPKTTTTALPVTTIPPKPAVAAVAAVTRPSGAAYV